MIVRRVPRSPMMDATAVVRTADVSCCRHGPGWEVQRERGQTPVPVPSSSNIVQASWTSRSWPGVRSTWIRDGENRGSSASVLRSGQHFGGGYGEEGMGRGGTFLRDLLQSEEPELPGLGERWRHDGVGWTMLRGEGRGWEAAKE